MKAWAVKCLPKSSQPERALIPENCSTETIEGKRRRVESEAGLPLYARLCLVLSVPSQVAFAIFFYAAFSDGGILREMVDDCMPTVLAHRSTIQVNGTEFRFDTGLR